jgi:hypothetical protein
MEVSASAVHSHSCLAFSIAAWRSRSRTACGARTVRLVKNPSITFRTESTSATDGVSLSC